MSGISATAYIAQAISDFFTNAD